MRLQKYVPSFDTQSITEMQHELAPGTFLKLSSVLSLSYGSIFITLSNSGYSYQDIIYLKPLSSNLNPWNITVICLRLEHFKYKDGLPSHSVSRNLSDSYLLIYGLPCRRYQLKQQYGTPLMKTMKLHYPVYGND